MGNSPKQTAKGEDQEGDAPISHSLPPTVRLLGYTSLLNDIASEAIYPLLPAFLKSLGAGSALLGLVEGFVDTLSSLMKPWIGGWSDRASRKRPFLLWGYALTALARPLMGLSTSVGMVIGLRSLDRVGKGIRTAPRDSLIASSVPASHQGRAFGYHRAMDHLGATIGPLLATSFLYFYPDAIRSLMFWTLLPGALLMLLLFIGLREPPASALPVSKAKTVESPSSQPVQKSLWTPNFRLFLGAVFCFALANSSDAFLLLRANELGVATVWLPLLWSMFHMVKSIGSRWGGYAADRVPTKKLIVIGWLLYGLVYMLFGFATQAWHAWVLFTVYAIFYSLTEPAEKKLVAAFAGKAHAGKGFGWFHMMLGLANFPASLLFGSLYQYVGIVPAFCTAGALAGMATLLLTRVRLPGKGETT